MHCEPVETQCFASGFTIKIQGIARNETQGIARNETQELHVMRRKALHVRRRKALRLYQPTNQPTNKI